MRPSSQEELRRFEFRCPMCDSPASTHALFTDERQGVDGITCLECAFAKERASQAEARGAWVVGKVEELWKKLCGEKISPRGEKYQAIRLIALLLGERQLEQIITDLISETGKKSPFTELCDYASRVLIARNHIDLEC